MVKISRRDNNKIGYFFTQLSKNHTDTKTQQSISQITRYISSIFDMLCLSAHLALTHL